MVGKFLFVMPFVSLLISCGDRRSNNSDQNAFLFGCESLEGKFLVLSSSPTDGYKGTLFPTLSRSGGLKLLKVGDTVSITQKSCEDVKVNIVYEGNKRDEENFSPGIKRDGMQVYRSPLSRHLVYSLKSSNAQTENEVVSTLQLSWGGDLVVKSRQSPSAFPFSAGTIENTSVFKRIEKK
jgi:hypothetical protein